MIVQALCCSCYPVFSDVLGLWRCRCFHDEARADKERAVLGCSTSTGLSIYACGTAQEIDCVIAYILHTYCIHIATRTLQLGTAACRSMPLSQAVAEVLLALWSSISFCSPQLQPAQPAQHVSSSAPSSGSWSRSSRLDRFRAW